MNTRERHRRDGAILAASRAGVPARKIAAEFGLSKRTCNRVIAAEREEHRTLVRSRAPGEAPSALGLLDSLDDLYRRACRKVRAGESVGVALSLAVEGALWNGYRAALEERIAELSARKEPAAPSHEAS